MGPGAAGPSGIKGQSPLALPCPQRPVLQPAEQPHEGPEQGEVDQRGGDDGGWVVGEALRLAGLEQQFGHGDDAAAPLLSHYFNFRKTSIYGGSNEVQSNIVSKRILGLPDLTQSH